MPQFFMFGHKYPFQIWCFSFLLFRRSHGVNETWLFLYREEPCLIGSRMVHPGQCSVLRNGQANAPGRPHWQSKSSTFLHNWSPPPPPQQVARDIHNVDGHGGANQLSGANTHSQTSIAMKFSNPLWKPSVLVAITTFYGREFHKLIVHGVKVPAVNPLLIRFIECPLLVV